MAAQNRRSSRLVTQGQTISDVKPTGETDEERAAIESAQTETVEKSETDAADALAAEKAAVEKRAAELAKAQSEHGKAVAEFDARVTAAVEARMAELAPSMQTEAAAAQIAAEESLVAGQRPKTASGVVDSLVNPKTGTITEVYGAKGRVGTETQLNLEAAE